jgi:WD40 repeat protein
MRRRVFLAGAAGLMCAPANTLAAGRPQDRWIETPFSSALAFSPDGTMLLTAGHGSHVATLWEVESGARVCELHTPARGDPVPAGLSGYWRRGPRFSLRCAVWSPDGTLLATAGDEQVIRLWDADNGREVAVLRGHKDSIRCLTFSPDSSALASGAGDHTTRVWDVATATEQVRFSATQYQPLSIAFSPDGQQLYSDGCGLFVRVWNVKGPVFELREQRAPAGLRPHRDVTFNILHMDLSPDGKQLALDVAGTIRIVDTGSWEEVLEVPGSRTRPVFSPDGRLLAAITARGIIVVCNVATGRPLFWLEGHRYGINSLAFSPNGRLLASGGGGWECLPEEPKMVSSDGKPLTLGGKQHAFVILWDLTSRLGTPFHHHAGGEAVFE